MRTKSAITNAYLEVKRLYDVETRSMNEATAEKARLYHQTRRGALAQALEAVSAFGTAEFLDKAGK